MGLQLREREPGNFPVIACAAVTLFASANPPQHGDIIAEKTGLERTRIGVALLMASAP